MDFNTLSFLTLIASCFPESHDGLMQILFLSPKAGRQTIKKILDTHHRNPQFKWKLNQINVWQIRQALLKREWILKRWGNNTLRNLRELQKEAAITRPAGRSRGRKIIKLDRRSVVQRDCENPSNEAQLD